MHGNRKHRIFFVSLLTACAVTGMGHAQSTQRSAPHRSTHRTGPVVRRSLLRPASLNEKAPVVYRAKFATTKGDFSIEVTRAWAPLGADRFYNLVKNGFFTDASFFRVVPGFVVQFGVPSKPAIARAWARANINDDPVKQSNAAGYVTYAAASAPNTRNTQVFINLKDNSALDGQGFAPFGRVVDGLDVVTKLYGGYGDGPPFGSGPDQERLTNEGKAYIDKNFPKLDSIKSAVIVKPTAGASPTSEKPPAGQ
jgi:peptidyl-prolyl cis-trans isomerase A (cyclophilin A)